VIEMTTSRLFLYVALSLLLGRPQLLLAQAANPTDELPPGHREKSNVQNQISVSEVSFKSSLFSIPRDQVTIWTSPFHLKRKDLVWVVPLTLTAGGLIGSDRHSMQRERSNADAISLSKHVSGRRVDWPDRMA
jgi:hypothetical protein